MPAYRAPCPTPNRLHARQPTACRPSRTSLGQLHTPRAPVAKTSPDHFRVLLIRLTKDKLRALKPGVLARPQPQSQLETPSKRRIVTDAPFYRSSFPARFRPRLNH